MADLEILIDSLCSDDDEERRGAVVALGCTGSPGAVRPLVAALRDEDDRVHGYACQALLTLGEAAVLPLCAALESGEPRVRLAAVSLLGALGDPRAVEPLSRALEDTDPFLVHTAAQSLGRLGSREAVAPLTRAVRRGNLMAARPLGRLVQPEEVEPLVEGLRDPVPWARWCAAIALGHAGDARAVPVLCHALPQAAGLDAASALALQEVLGALERIVQVRPVPGLRVALPTLRRFESSVLAHSRVNRSRCRALIRRIEAATDPVYDLPLPGRAAGVHYGELPQPASPGERGAASRPVPWEGGEPPEGRAGSLSLAAFLRSLLDRWRALRHPAA